MRRRRFIALLGGAAVAWPLGALAQSRGKPPLVGILMPEPTPFPPFDAFRQALRDLGHVEGLTIILDPRWPVGRQTADYLEIAREFVQHGVDVIVTGHIVSTLAAKEATTTIPIVIAAFAGDPVQLGFAKSIARPGYNITGMSLQTGDLPGKRLDLIKKIVPAASRIAMLVVDTEVYRAAAKDHEAPAHTLGIQLLHLAVRGPSNFETAFEEAKRGQADAMVLVQSALFYANSRIIAELSLKYRLPVLSGESGFAAAGGLMNHGPNVSDSWRRSAALVDKIVKGAKPGDLPIEQPTKFELVVNLKTAKALGITVPPDILIRADEVID